MEAHETVTLQKLLSKEDLDTLPPELKPRVEKVQNEFMEVFALYSTQRANLDGIREENDQKITELTEKYQDEFAKSQSSQICIQEQRQELDEARSELSKLTDSVKRLDAELVGYRKDRNEVIDERDSLMKRVERQNFEVERLEADIKALKQQVTSAINSKCEALSKYDEIQHKEANIDFKEKRMEQDKILLQNQIDCLTADLNRNVMELQKCRSETTSRTMTVEAKLYEKTEEVRIHTSTIAHLTDTNSSLNAKIEDLSSKLLSQSEEFAKMMEQYQKELLAKTKLADLYKENSEESLNQQRDMTNAVNELKSTLKEATDEYGILETKCKAMELQHHQEIEEKNKTIEEMQDELKNANKLLKLAQQESLDNAVEKLCPTAATTSRLIKSGKSLTEIYTLYVNATEENQILSKDNSHLKLRFQEVIQEIEEKAPLIHKQDLDLKLANEANAELSNQLESLIKDRVDSRGEIEELFVKIKSMEKQIKTLLIDRQDLGRQVCHLLKVIEEARGGCISTRDQSITSDMSGNEVITKRLVTFSDIQELQHNNAQLMAIVRDLTAKIDEMDEIKSNMDQATYEEKIENYAEKFKTLQHSVDVQTRMMEKCIGQRDHFKKLYQEASKQSTSGKLISDSTLNIDSFMEDDNTPHASNSSLNSAGLNSSIAEKDKKVSEMDSKIKEYEKQLKTLKEEYDIYRKEKHTNDEMLNKQFDTMRTELRELSTTNCKLQAQVEHHDCQLKLQQKNIATYKKQIQTLEERNKNYETTIIKHETSLAYLRDETMKATSNVSRSEMMIQKLTQDNRRLKEIESSLKAERDVLYRERQSQNLLQNNMEMIKVTFERLESEGKMRMEQRFDEITRECSALRRRLQEEQDHFRELSANCQRDTQTAKDRMEEEKTLASRYQEELNTTREEMEKKTAKIEDLSKKLQSSLTPTQSDNPVAQANKRVKELENKLKDNIVELEALQKDLSVSRQHVKQYCDMAELAEKQLQEMNEHKTRIDIEYAESKKNEMQFRQRVEELETEISLDINNKQLMAGDTNTQLHKAQSDLKDALLKISENNRELRDLREKSNTVAAALEAAEQKYSNEMILHSSDIKNMARLKEEMTHNLQQFDQLKLARDSAVQQLDTTRAMTKDREQSQTQEKLELETRLADMDKQNAALHDQIQTLSTKLSINVSQQPMDDSAMMNDSTADISMNRSIAEEDGKSSDQLLQIIKYLRKEKDIAVAKFDILRSENARLKSELNLIQKKLDETQLALNSKHISESDTGSLNSAKHEELLRKVETLNAITDSNRILREERDGLAVKVKALSSRVTKVEDELIPLQEKNRELTAKSETVGIENVSLRTEATRWRQRANALVERSNKNSPDDWKRLQGERENLAKMLQAEKDQHKKTSDEFNSIKQEKTKMDTDISNFTRQIAVLTADNKKNSEELIALRQSSAKMNQEMLEIKVKMDLKDDDLKKLAEELNNKEAQLTDIKNKEGQIRKIAKRYKDSYMELKKQVDEGTVSTIEKDDTAAGDANMGEPSTSNDQQSTAEGHKELENKIAAMVAEIEQMKAAHITVQSENEELRQAMAKEERNKTLLSLAKTKLSSLSERKDQLTRELAASRTEREQSREESEMLVSGLKSQYETRINRLEKEVTDQVAEKAEAIQRLQRENENLIMRVNQLHRQMGSQQSAKPATSTMEKSPSDASRTANVKPMAGPSQQSATVQPWRGSSNSGDTPLASIRPISVQNSRTAAVMPTSQTANVVSVQGSSGTSTSTTSSCSAGPSCASVTALVPPQQQVHTTASQPGEAMSSSPTSSHTDYMPATSSATSSVVVAAIPPMGSSSNAAESSSQSPEVEVVSNDSIQIITGGQPIQQAVALVSPRVESAPQQLAVQSQQQNEQNQAPSTSATPSASQQLPVPMSSSHHQASSSNTVTTTQAGGHKRPRDVEGDSSTSNDEPLDKSLPLKRTRVQGSDTFQGVSESGLEVEYQVPTSSQRDQEDDVIVVDSEEEDEDDEALPDDGNAEVDGPFEDDGNENFEMEEAYEQEQEMANYDEGPDIDDDDIIQSVNNEVEVEDLSEVPNQSGSSSITQQMAPDAGSSGIGQSSASSSNQEQVSGQSEQQIQSITSGSGNGNSSEEAGPSTSGSNLISAATSQWRPTGQQSSARQQANIMHLNYSEEASDDRIVPSTPTLLFRRNEVDSSPNPALVPHAPHTAARFTFGESSSSSRNASLNEGMDDTRIDLGSMEDHNNVSGRNVPSIPQQVSPGEILMNDSTSASTSSTSSSISTVILQQQDNLEAEAVAGSSSQEEGQVPEISITGADDDYDGASTSEAQDESDREKMTDPMCETDEGADGVSSEGEKTNTETTEDDTTSEADMLDHSPNTSRALRSGNVRGVQHVQQNARRSRGGMRGGQHRITPIVWNQQQQQQHQQMQQQQQQQQQQGHPSHPFPSPNQSGRGPRIRRGRGRGPANAGQYGNMRY